jgi:adenylate cyclase
MSASAPTTWRQGTLRWNWNVTATELHCWNESDRKAVSEQLGRILNSAPFAQSQRRRRFLEYLVNETLAGRGERLKGYNIAVEVFDRAEDFDPAVDPLVRIEAARLRDKLREYYEADGQGDPVHIELPKGGYAPQFEFRTPSEEAPPDRAAVKPDAASPRSTRRQVALPLAALTLLLGTIGFWLVANQMQPPSTELAKGIEQSLADIPAVAVLPFANLSGDPKQDYFSDGLTEDILTELSRARDLRVIARNTSFQYKGKAIDVGKVGRELNVRYVLEGSIQRSDDRLRVTAQLIDTRNGTHIWADRYDRELADVFLVQDEIVNQIVGKIAGSYGAIERNEAKSAARKSPAQIQAYDLVLRARDVIWFDWTKDTFSRAEDLLRQAISLDPSNEQARRELAWFGVMGWVFRLDDPPVPQDEIVAHAAKAVQLDPQDARARMVAASAYFFTKQLDQFRREADQALALAPYDAEIIVSLACMISAAGDHERGVALAEKANALNAEAASGWYHSTVYTAAYLKGDYRRALEVAKQNQDAEMFYSYMEIIPIYGQLGMKREAAEAWEMLQKQYPGVSAATFEDWWRLWNMPEADIAKLMEGVYKSGVLGAEG